MVSPENRIKFLDTLDEHGMKHYLYLGDVVKALDDHDEEISRWRQKRTNLVPFEDYPRYAQIDAYLERIAREYPNLVTIVNSGPSFEGRAIKYLKISTTNFADTSKPIYFIDAAIHAREWVTTPVALYAIHRLVENLRDSDRDLLQNVDWIIMPLVNPDGYEFSHTDFRMWRRTRSFNPAVSTTCYGVDGNRNFNHTWGTVGVSTNPCSDIYPGPEPFSEVEIRYVRDILHEYVDRIQLYLDIHSFGNYVLFTYGDGTLPPNAAQLHHVSAALGAAIDVHKLPQANFYLVGNSGLVLYPASGCADDYAQYVGVPFAICLELPDLGFDFRVPPEFIEQINMESWEGIAASARIAVIHGVELRDDNDLKLLSELEIELNVDIWRYGYPGKRDALVMVSEDTKVDFLDKLDENGVTHYLHISDVVKTLEDHDVEINKWRQSRSNLVPFENYPRYSEIDAYLERIAREYPNLVTLVNAGPSFEGRSVKYLKISTTNFADTSKPIYFIDAMIHAREWVTTPVALYTIHRLVEDLNESDRDLLENVDWIIMPLVNPDGYEYSHTDVRLWRGTRSIHPELNTTCVGVDGNRNFNVSWNTLGVSADPCSQVFPGPYPFSEPETGYVRDVLHEYQDRIQLYLDIHSHGNYVLFAYGDRSLPPNAAQIHHVGATMGAVMDVHKLPQAGFYLVGNSALVLYVSSGSAQDYGQIVGVPFSYTLELPGYGYAFSVPPQFIEHINKETWVGIAETARLSVLYYRARTWLTMGVSKEILVTTILVNLVVAGRHDIYSGYLVHGVELQDTSDLKFLRDLEPKYNLYVWQPGAPGLRDALIMVTRENSAHFLDQLDVKGFNHYLYLSDVAKGLQKHDEEIASWKRSRGNRLAPFDNYPRYAEVDAYMERLAAQYPNLVTIVNAGPSFEGRPIKYLKISTTNFADTRKPIYFMDAAMHGNEWVTTPVTLYAIHRLVEDLADRDRDLLNNIDWIILPIVNPDGYEYSHTDERLWRKTRSFNPSVSTTCYGVDANRNFNYSFNTLGVSDDPCFFTFPGPEPFSEVETRYVRDILHEYRERIQLYLNIHSFGNFVLFAYGDDTLPPNAAHIHHVGATMGAAIDTLKLPEAGYYLIGNSGMVLYPTSGTAQDYGQATGIPFSYTLELPAYGYDFRVPPQYIEQINKETWQGIVASARLAGTYYRMRMRV
ncbi:uncharacterized protein [Epargyreus clarus]|uniref:uncharacterized protein n=1 Tax=Epargyreus clarus TaxID=520877 RepID=UPI003C2C2AD9